MTEGGLLSNVAFKAMAEENFVCVRLFSTALGGGHAQVRSFLPGISDELRRHLMYQGNSLVLLTPDGKVINTRYEAVEQSKELTEADVQMEEKIPAGLLQLRQVMKRFPAQGKPVVAIPWQFSPAHALVVAWDDNRRIVAVPAQDGKVDAALEKSLSDPELLKKFHARFAFVKVGPEHRPPVEIQQALARAGTGGIVILDVPATDAGCFGSGKDHPYLGPWPRVLATVSGPHSSTTWAKLMHEHYLDLPTYVSQGCEATRKKGKPVRTGLEEFELLWKAAPASVRRNWTRADVEDMKSYTRSALTKLKIE
jgi:hypothetical protein